MKKSLLALKNTTYNTWILKIENNGQLVSICEVKDEIVAAGL